MTTTDNNTRLRDYTIRVREHDGTWMWCAQRGATHAAGGSADTREHALRLAEAWVARMEGER